MSDNKGSSGLWVLELLVLFPLTLWTLDQLGIERWSAEQIGWYAHMVLEAAK